MGQPVFESVPDRPAATGASTHTPRRRRRRRRRRCRLLPHGGYTLLVATLATMGWVASLFQDMCDFAQVSGPIVQQLLPTYTNVDAVPYLEFGFAAYREPATGDGGDGSSSSSSSTSYNYTVTVTGACTTYPNDALFDTAWMAGRAFAFLALVVGGGGTLFVWCSACVVFSRVTWRWTGYELLLASVCQACSFVWYMTQLCTWNDCTLSYGSKTNVLSAALWFVAGWMVVCRYPPPEREGPQGGADGESGDDDGEGEGEDEEGVDDHRSAKQQGASQGSGQATVEWSRSAEVSQPQAGLPNHAPGEGNHNDSDHDSCGGFASRFPSAEIS